MGDLWQWLNSAENDFEAARKTPKNLDDVPLKPILSVGILAVGKKTFQRGNGNLSCIRLQEKISTMDKFQVKVNVSGIVQPEVDKIEEVLCDWTDNLRLNLILTTGGTGFGSHDVTPEATRSIIDKEAHSMQSAITIASLQVTSNAMISRAVCGIRRSTLIVNLPRSPKASLECLSVILPALPLALSQLHRDSQNNIPFHNYTWSSTSNKTVKEINSSWNQSGFSSLAIYQTNKNSVPRNHLSTSNETRSNFMQGTSLIDFTKVARRPRTFLHPKISVDKAQKIVLSNSTFLNSEKKHYKDALGFVLAEDALADYSIPQHPLSDVDGYAVKASETPGNLNVILTKKTTHGFNRMSKILILGKNEAVRVKCGSPLPSNANAVVLIEDTLLLHRDDDEEGFDEELQIRVLRPANIGQNIIPIGSEVERGEAILRKGTVLKLSDIASLASSGIANISVHRKPVVAVVSTGKKFVTKPTTENESTSEEFPDSIRLILVLALKQQGYNVIDMGIADDPFTLQQVLLSGCEKADVIISAGGVSLGENDYVKPLLSHIGANVHFGQVSIKPGKLTSYATLDTQYGKKSFFALPGNSISAVTCFNIFVIPALKKMMGHPNPQPMIVKAKSSSSLRLSQSTEYQSVKLRWESNEDTPWADRCYSAQQSNGRFLNMVGVSALMILPPKNGELVMISKGQLINVMIIDQL